MFVQTNDDIMSLTYAVILEFILFKYLFIK